LWLPSFDNQEEERVMKRMGRDEKKPRPERLEGCVNCLTQAGGVSEESFD
jgi:hypothetical protein